MVALLVFDRALGMVISHLPSHPACGSVTDIGFSVFHKWYSFLSYLVKKKKILLLIKSATDFVLVSAAFSSKSRLSHSDANLVNSPAQF